MRPANSLMVMALAALTLGGPAFAGPAALQPAPAAAPAPVKGHAATVAMITGRGMALSADGALRALVKGSPVFEGELITTGPSTYLNLKFVDQSLFLLRPNSRFQIEEFSHAAPAAEPLAPARRALAASVTPPRTDTAFFRLLKGGFRAVTGAVGKTERERYRVGTPVATIGIRGTDFESRWCVEDCDDAGLYEQDGLFTYTQQGGITVRLGTPMLLKEVASRIPTWPGYSGMARLDLVPQALDPAVMPLVAEGGFENVGVGEKFETDGDSFNMGPSSIDGVNSFNANMDTSFSYTPPANDGNGGKASLSNGRTSSLGSNLSNPSGCTN